MTQNFDSLRLLSRAFTRPVFSEMARMGEYRVPLDFLFKRRIAIATKSSDAPLGQWFEDAWTHLATAYRNEYVYKNELATRLVFGRHSPRTAGFQVELRVGRSIVDVAVANGTSTAYEIKTEFDTARRLQSQTNDYLKAFDKVYVVTHPAHVARYEKELDSRVGLIVLSPKSSLTPYREAQSNAQNVDPKVVFRCLRREEYLGAVKDLFGEIPSLPNGYVARHCEALFTTLTPEVAHKAFVKALRARTTDKSTVDFVAQLPSSLRALGYATPLSGKQRNTMLDLLAEPAGLALFT
jgi:hypothetical protein